MWRYFRYFMLTNLFILAAQKPCSGQVFQQLYSFGHWDETNGWWDLSDGLRLQGALVQAGGGTLYGTAAYGGSGPLTQHSEGYGTVFKITPQGDFAKIFTFNWTNGAYPRGALLQAHDGNLYGTTREGYGSSGSLFRLTPHGQHTILAWFAGGVGADPVGDLAQGPDGRIYGVTQWGGACGFGTVFRVSTNGDFENLHSFCDDGTAPGGVPSGGLFLAQDGNFYGVTAGGGSCTGDGTVYRLTTNGTVTSVASFCQGPGNATWPIGKLFQATDGNFYGAAGGASIGTIFMLTSGGALITFSRVGENYTGQDPVGGLVQAHDGYLYGCTYHGGWGLDGGAVFRLDTRAGPCVQGVLAFCGNLTQAGWFGETAPGWNPQAGLTLGTDGNLYGTTAFGGYGAGNIFRIIMPGNECRLACPTNLVVSNDPGQPGAVVNFGPPVSTNCAGYVIAAAPPSGSFFPVGTNTVLWTAVDSASRQLTNTCTFQVIVRDCEPPAIQTITPNPADLWPPNHKMQPVSLRISAIDNCRVARSRIISVSSNDGTAADWHITGDLTLNLRAERSGNTPRVYTITIECADDSGNTATAPVQVPVAH